jgi:proline-rich protein PRCC
MDSCGAGSSALFSKLPAPKLAAPVKAAPERILGSGKGPGLIFNNASSQKTQDTSRLSSNVDLQDTLDVMEEQPMSLPFMPASVRKGKLNVSLEDSSLEKAPGPSPLAIADLFSLSVSRHFLIHFQRQTFSL